MMVTGPVGLLVMARRVRTVVEEHIEFRGLNSRPEFLPGRESVSPQGKRGKPLLEQSELATEVKQSTDGHVSADSGRCVDIENPILTHRAP